MQSEIAPEQVVITVAPIRDIATIRPSMVVCKTRSSFMYTMAAEKIAKEKKYYLISKPRI